MLRSYVHIATFLALLIGAAAAQADIITAQGKSSVVNGDVTGARQAAIRDAARTALMQAGFDLRSSTNVINVTEVNDQIRVSTRGQIQAMDVIDESLQKGIYQVTVNADIRDSSIHAAECPVAPYSKSLLVTAFNNRKPQSVRVGKLYNAESAIAQTLAERLYPQQNLEVQTQPELTLASGNRLLSNHYEVFNAVQLVASQYQTQYVVTGTIEDMSMANPDYFRYNSLGRTGNRVGSTLKSWVGANPADIRERQFSFRLMLHDGVTGTRIFDKTYSTRGLWDADYTAATGFASPGFWATDYGQAADKLLSQAALELGQKALCQPFMAPVKVSARDSQVYVLAGANSGVNVGDTFNIYAEGEAPFANIEHFGTMALAPSAYKKLDHTSAQLQITQTYPGYSIGTFDAPLQPYLRYMAVAH
ncbi:flagellar assembly protein T N-terminal domain-containing protein [Gilvimarinus sp. DA14]|uniref:flagellar assembly protein T N-terminal domain-containing protein n=1 Tax=Gilvimarinus sp. DA14 TaxID=2956798 RepID=UPI0020B846FB|nr:flagellar assembly protein T N-terminal domain-containing protein [Gilvimarinus sp. DA14]UTF58774.1 flagellar assembly protein FlgT [Gilvimarinus sp. DA14]